MFAEPFDVGGLLRNNENKNVVYIVDGRLAPRAAAVKTLQVISLESKPKYSKANLHHLLYPGHCAGLFARAAAGFSECSICVSMCRRMHSTLEELCLAVFQTAFQCSRAYHGALEPS